MHVSMCVCVCEAFSTNCLAVGWTKERMLCILFGLCRIFTKALQGTFALLSSQLREEARGTVDVSIPVTHVFLASLFCME